jgi:hypothetical protein
MFQNLISRVIGNYYMPNGQSTMKTTITICSRLMDVAPSILDFSFAILIDTELLR